MAKDDFGEDVYSKPYSHAQSYIIGVLFGYFLYKSVSKQFKLSLVNSYLLNNFYPVFFYTLTYSKA